jgi:hypothetical protein
MTDDTDRDTSTGKQGSFRKTVCLELCERIAKIGRELREDPDYSLYSDLADSALVLMGTAQSLAQSLRGDEERRASSQKSPRPERLH